MNRELLLHLARMIENSFTGFFLRRWNITILVVLATLIGGIYSLLHLPIESSPEITIPIGVVTTVYPGASPEDTEKLITDRLEERFANLDDINEMTSTSSEGVSVIVVEFDTNADLDQSIQDLRDEADRAQVDLPDGAEDPIVQEIRAGDESILTISLFGTLTTEELDTYATQIEKIAESVSGVSRAEITGLPRKEMQVLLSQKSLDAYNLSILDVVSAVRSTHRDLPIGSIEANSFRYNASWRGQIDTEEDLQNIALTTRTGQTVFLRDLGIVREVFAEPQAETRVFIPGDIEAHQSVTVQIYKKKGADLVRVTDTVKEKLENHIEKNFPAHARILFSGDYSEFVREDLSVLFRGGTQTILIIGLILFLAIGRREAIVASLSMPLLYLFSLVILLFIGETINFLTLFALILSLGIVVDNAIVIIEGIYDNVNRFHLSPRDAAMAALALYKTPLISSTLTTIAAFLPLALMSGIMGEYVSHIPITIAATLSASLFTALFIVPPIAAKYIRPSDATMQVRKPFLEKYMEPLKAWYGNRIAQILESKKRKLFWTLGMVGALLFSIALPIIGLLKIQMFPASDQDFFFASIEMAAGANLEQTKEVTHLVEQEAYELPGIKNVISAYGSNAVGGFQDGGIVQVGNGKSNQANITINLVEQDEREFSSQEIANMLRERIRTITAGHITVNEAQDGPPGGAPIEMRILGDSTTEIEQTADLLKQELATIEGTLNIDTDREVSTGELRIIPRRDRLTTFGITEDQIALILRTAVFGNDSLNIVRGGEETPIVIRTDFRDPACVRDTLTQLREVRDAQTICSLLPTDVAILQNLLIPTSKGSVPLSQLATVTLHPAVTSIHHIDSQRLIRVTADVREGYVGNDIVAKIQKRIPDLDIPENVTIRFGGENQELQESFQSLAWAQLVAILLIFVILVAQFNSFAQVFIILFTIPLGLTGVFIGLTLLGKYLSFPGLIGLAALSGIVVNDAIVMIDRINRNRTEGLGLIDAIVDAARERLQPILITTLTTSLGMLPLVFNGDFFGDLAATVSIGIVYATLLTLVMVPIFYMAFTRKKDKTPSANHEAIPQSATEYM